MASRYQAGCPIHLSRKQQDYIRRFREYRVAEEVILKCGQFSGFDVNEDEILAFALLLVFWADIPLDCKLADNYFELAEEAQKTECCLLQVSKKGLQCRSDSNSQ